MEITFLAANPDHPSILRSSLDTVLATEKVQFTVAFFKQSR